MTQLEILKFAMIGVSNRLNDEQKRKEKLNSEGKPSPIADYRIEKLTKQFDEVMDLIGIEERKSQVKGG